MKLSKALRDSRASTHAHTVGKSRGISSVGRKCVFMIFANSKPHGASSPREFLEPLFTPAPRKRIAFPSVIFLKMVLKSWIVSEASVVLSFSSKKEDLRYPKKWRNKWGGDYERFKVGS